MLILWMLHNDSRVCCSGCSIGTCILCVDIDNPFLFIYFSSTILVAYAMHGHTYWLNPAMSGVHTNWRLVSSWTLRVCARLMCAWRMHSLSSFHCREETSDDFWDVNAWTDYKSKTCMHQHFLRILMKRIHFVNECGLWNLWTVLWRSIRHLACHTNHAHRCGNVH